MSLQGKVTAVTENTATVSVVPRAECSGCHACSGLMGNEGKPATREIRALKGNISVQTGDEVELDLNPGEGSIAALLVFGFPMAGFFLGIYLAPYLGNLFGVPLSDFLRIISGFACMAMVFIVLAIFSRSRHADKLTMKIVRKIEPSEKPTPISCPLSK